MSLSMYDLSAPKLIEMMKNCCAILKGAIAFSEDKNLDLTVLPSMRLTADMLPLSKQIQLLSDQCKGCVARLAGIDVPSMEDTETTLPELIERLEKTIAFVESITPEQINGSEEKTIELVFPGITLTFPGATYLTDFLMPNAYFHYTTAYNILRQNGLAIGKQEFLGASMMQYVKR